MLRKIRIALACLMIVGITLLFLGTGLHWWGWAAKLQFIPSVLALNVAVIAGICLFTLIFGRLYCSVICPLGVFQDSVAWLRRKKLKKHKFRYSGTKKWLRYGVWAVFVAMLLAGVQVVVAFLDPYSIYGRFIQSITAPTSWLVAIISIAVMALVFTLAFFGRRIWCDIVCPVGTTLSFLSRFAMFRPTIDVSKCQGCHSCEKTCKASCIDSSAQKIDYTRCIDCFDCIDDCHFGAIKYRFAWKRSHKRDNGQKSADAGVDSSKRAFMAGALAAGASLTLKAQKQNVDGGLAAIEGKKRPERSGRLVPFGSEGVKEFYSRCTACQLCVAACPNKVLSPSTDLAHLMQPQMSYENGYCRPECTECSQVCPAGAIKPITPEQKSVTHIGRATVDYDLCVVNRDGVSCGNCARHCPVGAIKMVKNPAGGRPVPTVIEEKCIGCGACEFLCPARPYSAIHVNGLKEHYNE